MFILRIARPSGVPNTRALRRGSSTGGRCHSAHAPQNRVRSRGRPCPIIRIARSLIRLARRECCRSTWPCWRVRARLGRQIPLQDLKRPGRPREAVLFRRPSRDLANVTAHVGVELPRAVLSTRESSKAVSLSSLSRASMRIAGEGTQPSSRAAPLHLRPAASETPTAPRGLG